MDEQTRATLILAAATVAAARVQDHPGTDAESSVKIMYETLQEMEKWGLVPKGFLEPYPEDDEPMPMVVG